MSKMQPFLEKNDLGINLDMKNTLKFNLKK